MGEEIGLVVAGSKLVLGVFVADWYFVISSLVYQNIGGITSLGSNFGLMPF